MSDEEPIGRGRSTGRRSRSPSRASDPSLARQETTLSLPPFLSPRPSPQPPHEDYLWDLISVTGSSADTDRGSQHGVKRPRDDETVDEPLAKRDKLCEELERMSAPGSAPFSAMAASPSPAVSASANGSANGTQLTVPGDQPLTSRARDAFPHRHPVRPLRLGSGTVMSRNGIPEALEPPVGRPETDHSADDRGTHGETSP